LQQLNILLVLDILTVYMFIHIKDVFFPLPAKSKDTIPISIELHAIFGEEQLLK